MPPRPVRRGPRTGGAGGDGLDTGLSITDTPVISAETVPVGGRGGSETDAS